MRRGTGLLLVAAVLTLTACADEPEPVTLPPLAPSERATATTTSASPTPTPSTDQEREDTVRDVYTRAIHAFHTAQGLPAYQQRDHLARWETDPLLSEDLATLEQAKKGHYRLVGRPKLHVIDVTVAGDTATVEDCVDNSDVYWEDARTGRAIAGTRQPAGIWSFTTVTHTEDGWRVSETTSRKKRCTSG